MAEHTTGQTTSDLWSDVDHAGYYPELMADAMREMVKF